MKHDYYGANNTYYERGSYQRKTPARLHADACDEQACLWLRHDKILSRLPDAAAEPTSGCGAVQHGWSDHEVTHEKNEWLLPKAF